MVLVTYEIHYPCATTDPGEQPPPPTAGALEMAPSAEGKLRMRDVAAQWPFAGAFHFRALYTPPSEPHVFLDLPDVNMALPVTPDGAVVLRALPLDFLAAGVPRAAPASETWAWGEADLAAFRASRSSSSSSSSSSSGGGGGAEGGASPWGAGGGGSDASPPRTPGGEEEGGEAWSHLDGGFQEGGPSIGGRGGTLAEAAEEGLAQAAAAAAAARDAAGEAAGAAYSAAKKMFSGWGAAMKGALGKGSGTEQH